MRAHRLCSLLLTFLAVLCMTAVPSAVSAAGSEEPENDYYREHWEEFAREDRVYLLTEDQELFDAPDGEPLTELKEGDSVRISYAQPEDGESGWLSGIFQEQERWGLTEVARGGTWYTGWLIMDSMELPYDGKEFFAEYESEIQPYAVELDPETARAIRDSRSPEDDHSDTCSMCGKFCAVRSMNKALAGEYIDIL